MNLLNLLEEVAADKVNSCIINLHPVFYEQVTEEAEGYIQSIFKRFRVLVELPKPLVYVAGNGIEITVSSEPVSESAANLQDVTGEFYGILLDEFAACE